MANHIRLDKNNKLNHFHQYVYKTRARFIKCIGFKLMHYTINFDAISHSKIFSEFDSLLL